jgi:hypothetical protein
MTNPTPSQLNTRTRTRIRIRTRTLKPHITPSSSLPPLPFTPNGRTTHRPSYHKFTSSHFRIFHFFIFSSYHFSFFSPLFSLLTHLLLSFSFYLCTHLSRSPPRCFVHSSATSSSSLLYILIPLPYHTTSHTYYT